MLETDQVKQLENREHFKRGCVSVCSLGKGQAKGLLGAHLIICNAVESMQGKVP